MTLRWELANDRIRRVVTFDPRDGLVTSRFTHLATRTELLGAASRSRTPEFDLRVNGERVTSLDESWDLVSGTEPYPDPGLAADLSLRLRHRRSPLEVHVGYRCDPYGTTKRCWIRNAGTETMSVTGVAIETLPVAIGSPGELQLDAHYGSLPRETFLTGRVDDPAIVLRNARTGETVIALNEAPGHLKRTESGGWFWDGFLRIMYDTDLCPLEVQLAPGEAWGTASARIVLAVVGHGHADPRWVMPASLGPRPGPASGAAGAGPAGATGAGPASGAAGAGPAATPTWQFNTWDPFGTRIDEPTVDALIPLAARMGFEVFAIDDGWQAAYGANAVSPERFPGGLERVREAVEGHGMRLGLWAPLAAVDPAMADADPALAAARCRDTQDRVKTTMTAMGEQVVLCLAGGYAPLAAERLSELVERYRLAYLKLDLTTAINAYGEAPGCHATGHGHATPSESVLRIHEAIAAVTADVRARHPSVRIDLTFEAWGHKHGVDYALLHAADLSWISNVGDASDDAAGPRQARTLLCQRSLAIPVERMLIGNLRADTGDLDEKLATAIGSCPLLLGDLRRLAPAQLDRAGDLIRWHRRLRREVDLSASFFPLGSWRQPGVLDWDGFARLSREGEGVIVLFRNESNAAHATVRLPLPGTSRHVLTSAPDGAPVTSVRAADFRAGFDVAFGGARVLVLEVRRGPAG